MSMSRSVSHPLLWGFTGQWSSFQPWVCEAMHWFLKRAQQNCWVILFITTPNFSVKIKMKSRKSIPLKPQFFRINCSKSWGKEKETYLGFYQFSQKLSDFFQGISEMFFTGRQEVYLHLLRADAFFLGSQLLTVCLDFHFMLRQRNATLAKLPQKKPAVARTISSALCPSPATLLRDADGALQLKLSDETCAGNGEKDRAAQRNGALPKILEHNNNAALWPSCKTNVSWLWSTHSLQLPQVPNSTFHLFVCVQKQSLMSLFSFLELSLIVSYFFSHFLLLFHLVFVYAVQAPFQVTIF